ncbi:MAG: ATP-dependent DNA helicase RecG [Chitinophagales bacterium]|nr:ATP-dependent DNA helicase RecG [Chitinophagales bacterium]MCZ2392960.1 ATP-dependent DNA helicase RecG [Chitinophagales bacterium]
MPPILDTPIEYLKGISTEKANILKREKNIHTYRDLLEYYPYRYVDRSKFTLIAELTDSNTFIQLKGRFIKLEEIKQVRGKRLVGLFQDERGSIIEVVWFNAIKWVKDFIKPNEIYVLFDKPHLFNGKYNLTHPEIETFSSYQNSGKQGYQALYNTSEKMKLKGLDSRGVLRLVQQLLQIIKKEDIIEILPRYLLEKYRLPEKYISTIHIHQPPSLPDQLSALRRMKFEELFVLQLQLVRLRLLRTKENGILLPEVGELFNIFYRHHLPFSLTNAQKRVLKEIRKDTMSGHQMNRLLQGDVGSGKTIVALLTMLMGIGNGYQSALMAPTEILAQQHFDSIKSLVQPINLRVELLSGTIKGKKRTAILQALENGEIDILIGTHALIEPSVKFKNVGIIVIDEQHRFGVQQRAQLKNKAMIPPHILVMTATPIPRSLAMVFYGDLDYSVINELPPGRKPIKTIHKTDAHRLSVYGFMSEEISKGRQVYVVYPLIEESEKSDLASLMEGYDSLCKIFPRPQYQISIVHGKMKSEFKDIEMQQFIHHKSHIMVATTVIEVGVNIPNASVMVIENAERFGLSQLHQLRGRVGRGAEQSFCILMTGQKLSNESKVRIQTMCDTNDGFKISEVDLDLRGPGNIEGTQQSGDIQLKLSNLAIDKAILEEARNAAILLLENDPSLNLAQHAGLKYYFNHQAHLKGEWSQVL